MSLLERLTTERKARLARIAAAAYRREIAIAKPAIVALAPTEPTPIPEHAEPVPWRKEWISTTTRIKIEVLKAHPEVTLRDLDSHRRSVPVALARHIAMYLTKVLTGKSLPEIGRRLGGRDHTTVLHGIKKVERMIESDEAFAAHVAGIRQRIEESSNADQ
jgi:hypothetical protein